MQTRMVRYLLVLLTLVIFPYAFGQTSQNEKVKIRVCGGGKSGTYYSSSKIPQVYA